MDGALVGDKFTVALWFHFRIPKKIHLCEAWSHAMGTCYLILPQDIFPKISSSSASLRWGFGNREELNGYIIITSSMGHLDDVSLPNWTPTQQLYDITCWAHGCESHNLLSSWMGASFSLCLLEDNTGDHHLNAPYYWLCPVTQLEEAGYRKKSCHLCSPLGQWKRMLVPWC